MSLRVMHDQVRCALQDPLQALRMHACLKSEEPIREKQRDLWEKKQKTHTHYL